MKFLLMREILQENEEMGLWVWRLKSIKEGKFEEIGDGKKKKEGEKKERVRKGREKTDTAGCWALSWFYYIVLVNVNVNVMCDIHYWWSLIN